MFLIRQKHARKTAIMLYRVLKTPLDDFFDKILSSFVRNTLLQSFRARPNTKNSFQLKLSENRQVQGFESPSCSFVISPQILGTLDFFVLFSIQQHAIKKKQYFDTKSAFIEINSTLYKQFFTSAYPVWHFCSFSGMFLTNFENIFF